MFWGSVAANNQPVSTKYMYAAKRKGTKIIVINPYREPAMDGYWIPSIRRIGAYSARSWRMTSTKLTSAAISRFMHGVMKHGSRWKQASPAPLSIMLSCASMSNG